MKRLAIVSGILALVAPLAFAQSSTWKADSAHSSVGFGIKHMGLSTVRGRFGSVDATIVYNEGDVTKSTVTATIDVTGVNTGMDARDNHLKTDAFFDGILRGKDCLIQLERDFSILRFGELCA